MVQFGRDGLSAFAQVYACWQAGKHGREKGEDVNQLAAFIVGEATSKPKPQKKAKKAKARKG